MKQCRRCEVVKDDGKFYRQVSAADGLYPYCKECVSIKNAERYQRNRDAVIASQREWYAQNRDHLREYHLTRTHDITVEELVALLELQEGRCALCGELEVVTYASGRVKALGVDHDHSHCPGIGGCRECVRGLLCDMCNRRRVGRHEAGLGITVEWVERVEAYLAKKRPLVAA